MAATVSRNFGGGVRPAEFRSASFSREVPCGVLSNSKTEGW
jgi:hypothetical protein